MKKILAIFAVLALAFSLFACGRDKNKTTAKPATTTTVTTRATTTATERTTTETSRTSDMTTSMGTTASTQENSHPTGTAGTTASQSERGGTMPDVFTLPPAGTAPGGSTSVR